MSSSSSPLYKNYLSYLKEYIALKSVSTDVAYKRECVATANWLKNFFTQTGAKTQTWVCGTAHPVIFAEYFVDAELPTILIYGHYDVQPAEKSDGWKSDPFTLTETKTHLIARGIVDNKGQTMIHLTTVAELFKQKMLRANVKFIIEGNEESGNAFLPQLLRDRARELQSDAIIISDGEILGTTPTLEVSLRGGANYTLRIQTGATNVHSGLYGGALPNAPQILANFLATLFDNKTGKVNVPDFYKNAPKLNQQSIERNKKLSTEKTVRQTSGSFAFTPEKGLDFLTQVGLRPTLQVTGVTSGYVGEGYANIVPAHAEARINLRTVFPQKTRDVMAAFERFVKNSFPKYVQLTLTHSDPYDPSSMDPKGIYAERIQKLHKKIYGKETYFKHVGGGIPIVLDMQKILKRDPILLSLGNDDCNMHGANENFSIDLIKKGLQLSWKFFGK